MDIGNPYFHDDAPITEIRIGKLISEIYVVTVNCRQMRIDQYKRNLFHATEVQCAPSVTHEFGLLTAANTKITIFSMWRRVVW
jgi:hypothetical protein